MVNIGRIKIYLYYQLEFKEKLQHIFGEEKFKIDIKVFK